MTDSNPPAPKPGEERKEGRKPFGPFLIIAMAMILLLVIYGTSQPADEIGEDLFWYKLYSGRVQAVVERPPDKLVGTLLGTLDDPTAEVRFKVTIPDTSRVHAEIREAQAKKLDPAPVGPDTFRVHLEDGSWLVTRAYALRIREPNDPKDPAAGTLDRQRMFVDYFDGTGAHYTEVVGTSANSLEMAALTRMIQANAPGAEIRDLRFDVASGLKTEPGNSLLMYFVTAFGPILLLIALFWFIFMRQMRGQGQGLLSFGRSRAVLYNTEKKTGVTFKDVAGIEEAKDEVSEIIEFLKHPGKFQRLGGRIPRGVLLVGPPGTGKTLLAKAIAGEADVPFLSISGSDFVEMFVGVGASRVRDLFKVAKESAPCIVFLDEIDAVGRKRGSGMGGGHDEREQTLNAILVEMDGFGTDEGIILVAATNRPDVLDPALLRPGRFDREIVIDLPDVKGREKILRVHTTKVRLSTGVDLAAIAKGTPGFSGAELAALVNEAAIHAAMTDRDYVAQDDFEEARDKVMFGRQKKSRVMDEEDRVITAYHEAGHAVVNMVCEHTDPVHKVTIIPRGMAIGATMFLPEKDKLTWSRKKILDSLSVAYGGRVAERIFCDDITSGAANDIKTATHIAKLMVTEWGMSERLGPVHLADRHGSEFLGTEISVGKDHSEATVREIDEEIKTILEAAHDRAERILLENRAAVDRVAQALLRYETLHGEEVERLMAGTLLDDLRPEEPPTAPAPESGAPRPGRDVRPAKDPRGFARPGEEGLSPA
ncbi:MAG TPA: ATP-dependent zinc metalloprotease FtsH [Planctomycetota bacterium]